MKTIAVIFGSRSTEHDISIMTAISSVIRPLEASGGYTIETVYIDKKGAWHWDDQLKDITFFTSGKIDDFLQNDEATQIQFDDGLKLVRPGRFGTKQTTKIDVVFPATHGTFGEDGSLMGLLRMAGVPYVGCDMESSVIAMNKLLAHQLAEANGVKEYPRVGLFRTDFENDREASIGRLAHLRLPLFVKPVHLGSSIGITRVTDRDALDNALEVAFHYDTQAIVEEAIPNLIEVTVPIIGRGSEQHVACVERPLFDLEKAFDFDTKYLQQGKGKSQGSGKFAKDGAQGYSELPAKLSKELYASCEDLAKRIFSAIGCEGIARVDLLIDSKTNHVFFNEINPMPGSLYLHNWRKAGWSAVQVVDTLISYAEERAADEQRATTVFTSSFLKQF
jgi:D-alanine-D-alanine ligase